MNGRSSPLHPADHWHDPALDGSSAHFDLRREGNALSPVKASDQAPYRCCIDIRSSPSRKAQVNLITFGGLVLKCLTYNFNLTLN